MSGIKWTMIANCTMWIASALAVLGAVYITKNANCLWGLFVPAIAGGFSYKSSKEE